jgi:hypothetical protein
VTTLHYVSQAMGVEFDYPVDWQVGASADNKSIGLSSAPISVKGQDYYSHAILVVNISDPSSPSDRFDFFSDDATISWNSEALTYTNPTNLQRKATHMSFISDRTGASSDFIIVTGNLVYSSGQKIGSQDYKAITPHIDAYLFPCNVDPDSHCQGFVTVPITKDQWQNEPTFVKLRQVVASIRFTK